MNSMQNLIIFTLIFQCFGLSAQMEEVLDFGTNPGNLKMFLFEPTSPKVDAEVVLVLHGCLQNATNFAEQTGWNVLAEQYGFYVVYAQQKIINNTTKCFNWFLDSDNARDMGEAKSLVEMVKYVHDNFSVDTSKNYVCGLSAGGAMSPVMMACYPDIFKSGGIWAGSPYLIQTENVDLTPQEWGNKVRNAFPYYDGSYPTLFICQGTGDSVVKPINESRLVDQWTNVHNSDQIPESTNTAFNGNMDVEENIYLNMSQDTILKSYLITGMGHGIAVDLGSGPTQGGVTSQGSFDVDFYSTYWMADFFGLLDNDVVNSTGQVDVSEIKVFTLSDGSLQIINDTETDHLQVVLFDILGRRILNERLGKEMIFTSNQFNGQRVIVVSIINKTKQKIFSKLVYPKLN